jgi:hypothetical protein
VPDLFAVSANSVHAQQRHQDVQSRIDIGWRGVGGHAALADELSRTAAAFITQIAPAPTSSRVMDSSLATLPMIVPHRSMSPLRRSGGLVQRIFAS